MADALALAPVTTTVGLIELVLLHETRSPLFGRRYDADAALVAMRLMRLVIRNRLKHPRLFGAPHAVDEADIVRIRSQFGSFADAPQIPQAFLYGVNTLLHIANDAADPRAPVCAQHVRRAIVAATEPAPPAGTGTPDLYFWRTEGAGPPGPYAHLFRTVQGNSFYTQHLP